MKKTSLVILVSVLTLLPFVGLLIVPSYSKTYPEIGGLPFFYWYQILWLFLAAILFVSASLIWNRTEEGD
ncbi:DUF3311 domain-containing protein [Oxyplasma meridianum]|uniref:DUF3311 domain-containing protein n=1 Tax=Oxyplasma meridianum TaxID=3073602 RepID=A0AAX4NFI5_9ARCH